MSLAPPQLKLTDDPPIDEWIDQFHRNGYLVIENVLPPDLVATLKADLDRLLGP